MFRFPVTLAQGPRALWAQCTPVGHGTELSTIGAFFVDTVPPETCGLTFPLPDQFLDPTTDEDNDIGNGIQITMVGAATAIDDDIEGQPTLFGVDDAQLSGSLLDGGQSSVGATFSSAGPVMLSFSLEDRAGNLCASEQEVTVDLAGCPITHQAPTGPVTVDSNPLVFGFQTEIVTQTDAACEGQPIVTTCGAGGSAVVGTGGLTTLEVTLSSQDTAEGFESCRTDVTATSGFVTSAPAAFIYDNLGPFITLLVDTPPALPCGSQFTSAVDSSPGTPGVQVHMNVISPLSTSREIIVNGGTPIPLLPGQIQQITLVDGWNSVVAIAEDALGNQSAASCPLGLVDILVGFSPPIDDGFVNIDDDDDGNVAGGLTLDLAGTVSNSLATVSVSIDGGPAQPASVVGNTWTLAGQTLSEGSHQIQVNAQQGSDLGFAELELAVDLTPALPPTNLSVIALTRQSARLTFDAPADAVTYLGWFGVVPLTDANVDIDGTPFAMPVPSAPGTPEIVIAEGMRPGGPYHFAIASVDEAGNRTVVSAPAPITLDFDRAGPVSAPLAQGSLGYRLARGDFNGDSFQDVAVSAPSADVSGQAFAGLVYVYFGSATGLPADPSVTILGPTEFGDQFGIGLTSMRWNGDDIDDLFIGAPFADGVNGRVFGFAGGATFNPGSVANADIVIAVNPANGPTDLWNTSALGWSMASGRFNSDALDDLAIAAIFSDGGVGGVLTLYGGTFPGPTVLLSETDLAGLDGALGHFVANPDPAWDTQLFGIDLWNVGPAEGPGDVRDDLAIGYYSDFFTTTTNEKLYVLRGRATTPAMGIATTALGPNDMTLIHSGLSRGENFGEFVTSIDDQDGDGARDLAVSAAGAQNRGGRVYLVSGGLTGTRNLSDPGVLLTEFQNSVANQGFGAFLATGGAQSLADLDNDGLQDLVIGGGRDNATSLFVWFGGSIPGGAVLASAADLIIPGPLLFDNQVVEQGQPSPLNGIWVDVNADGLDDICWSDHRADNENGSFEVLWDAPVP
jgi:hypothetical protein